MLIDVRSTFFTPVYQQGNVTTTSITVPTVTTTMPSGDGLVVLGDQGSTAPSGIQLLPYGTGLAGQFFYMVIYGWRPTVGRPAGIPAWIPYPLAQFVCTLCAFSGVGSSDVPSTQLFCDTIQLALGNFNVSVEIVSPQNGTIAHAIVTSKGSRFLSVLFGTSGSASSANTLVATL